MPLRLHSRRPEAAAEDKCKFEARSSEREWQTDARAVPLHSRNSFVCQDMFVEIFFDAAFVFTNYSLEITPKHQWQVPLGKLFN